MTRKKFLIHSIEELREELTNLNNLWIPGTVLLLSESPYAALNPVILMGFLVSPDERGGLEPKGRNTQW